MKVLEFIPREVVFGSEGAVGIFDGFGFFGEGEDLVGDFPGGDDFVDGEEVFFAAAKGFANEEGVFTEAAVAFAGDVGFGVLDFLLVAEMDLDFFAWLKDEDEAVWGRFFVLEGEFF